MAEIKKYRNKRIKKENDKAKAWKAKSDKAKLNGAKGDKAKVDGAKGDRIRNDKVKSENARIERTKNEKPKIEKPKSEETNFGKKIILHRVVVAYRAILIAAIIVAIIAIAIVKAKNRVFGDYQVMASADRQAAESSEAVQLGENILFYGKDGASCYDRKGVAVWDLAYEMQNPILDVCKNVAAIGDYNGRSIFVVNSSSTVGEIDTKMPIRSFSVSANGVVAAVLDGGTSVTWIYLFDSTGKQIAYFKTAMDQSGYPLELAISESGYLVSVSYLYMDNTSMRTSVAFYNFGQVGQNEIDNFVSSYDYADTIVPHIHFFGDGRAIAVADNRLMFYEGDQKPMSQGEYLLDNQIERVCYGNGYVALIYNDVTGNALYKADIYGEDGKLEDTIYLDMQFKDMLFGKGKVIIYNEQRCIVHTIGGNDNFDGEFNEGVLTLMLTDTSYEYVAVTKDSIETIKLQ